MSGTLLGSMYTKLFFMTLLFAISGVVHAVSTLQAGEAPDSTSTITISEPVITTADAATDSTDPTTAPDHTFTAERVAPAATTTAPRIENIIAALETSTVDETIISTDPRPRTTAPATNPRTVPFYSQFTDISAPE